MTTKNKTIENNNSIEVFLKKITDTKRRKDIAAILLAIEKKTKITPKMWGSSIVGFGSFHYKYESGREGDAPLVALASRASAITFYLGDFENKEALFSKLGKHKLGKGCLYIKNLEDVDIAILIKIIQGSITHRKKFETR